MAFHIEIETNIDDASLDVESCEEVITFLENSYKNVRAEIYSYCLGMRTLKYALISIVVNVDPVSRTLNKKALKND